MSDDFYSLQFNSKEIYQTCAPLIELHKYDSKNYSIMLRKLDASNYGNMDKRLFEIVLDEAEALLSAYGAGEFRRSKFDR